MSEQILIAAIAALPPTLMAAVVLVINLKHGVKLDGIAATTNGNLARLTDELRVAKETIEALHKLAQQVKEGGHVGESGAG